MKRVGRGGPSGVEIDQKVLAGALAGVEDDDLVWSLGCVRGSERGRGVW